MLPIANDNAPQNSNEAAMSNALASWDLRSAVQESGLVLKLCQASDEGFTGQGGFFDEWVVLDADACQWARFTGPFAKINALRFMNAYVMEQLHAQGGRHV